NLLDPTPHSCRHIMLPYPVIDNDELAKLIHVNDDGDLPGYACTVLSGLYEVDGGGPALAEAIERVRREASEAIAAGARTLVLSDRDSDHRMAPIPSLLLVSAVHHHLVRTKERLRVGLVVESGDCREVHHVALLLGYGAAAVNPYLAFETIENLVAHGVLTGVDAGKAVRNYVKAAGKGVLKVMSKMGISTVASYTGAQVFEALGLSGQVVAAYFTGTTSRLGGGGGGAGGPRGGRPGTAGPTGRPRRRPRTAGGRWAGSTRGGARARRTCSTRRRCSCCSTPPGPGSTRCSSGTPPRWTGCPGRRRRCAGCSSCAPGCGRRCRSRRWSRSRRSAAGSPPGRCRTAPSRPT